METSYWTAFNFFFIFFSIVLSFITNLIIYTPEVFTKYSLTKYHGVALAVFELPQFWMCLLLSTVVLIVPVVAKRFYMTNITPTLLDRVRMKQVLKTLRPKVRSRLRRVSTRRRMAASTRSGYAFAHQSGFGKLITSGTMRQRPNRGFAAARQGRSEVCGIEENVSVVSIQNLSYV